MSPSPYRPVAPVYRPGTSYLTVPEIATELRVSKMTVYRLIESGALLGYRIGRSVRVAERDLDAYLRSAVEWTPKDGAA